MSVEEASRLRPKKTNISYMCKGALPLDRAGTFPLPQLEDRELVAEYLKQKQITKEILTSHLSEMFQ